MPLTDQIPQQQQAIQSANHLSSAFRTVADELLPSVVAIENRITEQTLPLLLDLARAQDLEGWIARMFGGERINSTENRAVLHVALRNRSNRPIEVDGRDVMPGVNAVLERMEDFTNGVRRPSTIATRRPSTVPGLFALMGLLHVGGFVFSRTDRGWGARLEAERMEAAPGGSGLHGETVVETD